MLLMSKKVFTKSLHDKNANIADFVLVVTLEMKKTNELCNLEM